MRLACSLLALAAAGCLPSSPSSPSANLGAADRMAIWPGDPASPCAAASDGTPCDDGDACTQVDTCQGGVCVGGDPVVCAAADACHVAGTCDPASGRCSNPLAGDGSACTMAGGSGTCAAGVCAIAACDSGRADCNGNAADGCETDLTSDAASCGACGQACGPGGACSASTCVYACRSAVGSVEQAQLQSPGWYTALSPSQEPVGQTLVAGADGELTGIEVGLHRCGQDDPNASVQLAVTDPWGNVVATASLPVSQLDSGCGGTGLAADSITGAFFDLAPACAQVAAGEALSFELSLVGASAVCDPVMHTCSGSGMPCSFDQECQISLRLDDNSDSYANGGETLRGSADGAYDLAFKTFVY